MVTIRLINVLQTLRKKQSKMRPETQQFQREIYFACSLSNTLQTDSPAAAASMSRLATLKMKIYRARRDKLGVNTLPKTSQDMLNLPEEYKKLDSGEQFLVSAEMVDDEHVSLIFMSGKFV